MRTARITIGRPAGEGLVGAVLTRDLTIGGERWSKGAGCRLRTWN